MWTSQIPDEQGLLLVGLNHRTAPLGLRERLSLGARAAGRVRDVLTAPWCEAVPADCGGAACGPCEARVHYAEGCVLSTCNRTELYAFGSKWEPLSRFLSAWSGVAVEALQPHLYARRGAGTVDHLFRVAAGLDSQLMGESQILGQVRAAFEAALDDGHVGAVFSALFRHAIRAGKRVRTETALGRFPASLASVAAQHLNDRGPGGRPPSVLLVGAGRMGAVAASALRHKGVTRLTVANRTRVRAQRLAGAHGGRALDWADLAVGLAEVDAVICVTGAPGPVLPVEAVAHAMRARGGRPLTVIDLAVPRDVAPAAGRVPGVTLVDLDQLKGTVDANLAQRRAAVPKAEAIVAEETAAFARWLRERQVAPYIRLLRERAEAARSEEVRRALPKLGLSEDQRQGVEALSTRLVNKLLHGHTQRFKQLARQAERPQALFEQLFELDPGAHDAAPRPQPDVQPLDVALARLARAGSAICDPKEDIHG